MNAATKVGETYDFALGTGSMRVMVEAADEHEVVYRALNDQDAIDRGWMPTSYGTYEATTTPAEFGRDAVMTADAPTTAPQDHGPLAAVLSDRTLAKVLSRPAHVPSIVALDRLEAADRLAAAVEDVARVLRMVRGINDSHAYVPALLKALDDYRAAVQS